MIYPETPVTSGYYVIFEKMTLRWPPNFLQNRVQWVWKYQIIGVFQKSKNVQ